jgi:hypothetical protein
LASRRPSSTRRSTPLAIRPFQEASFSPPVAASETPVPTTTSTLFAAIRSASSTLSASVMRAVLAIGDGTVVRPLGGILLGPIRAWHHPWPVAGRLI